MHKLAEALMKAVEFTLIKLLLVIVFVMHIGAIIRRLGRRKNVS